MALKIVYIADKQPTTIKGQKLSAKQILHNKAVESLAATKILDRQRAKKMFAPERAKLAELIKERDDLRKRLENIGKK